MSKQEKRSSDVLHAVVGESAGGTLRQALRGVGRKDRIIVLPDNLSFGPIDPPEPAVRLAWAERELGLPASGHPASWRAESLKRCSSFWDAALSPSGRRVFWVSRRSAQEYAGLLEWIWRLGDECFDVVDLTGVEIAPPGDVPAPFLSLGELNPDRLRESACWDRAAPLSVASINRYREMWRKLRAENAPFRIVAGDDLVSAPITFYDDLLLSCTVGHWRKVARVVGDAFGMARDRGMDVGTSVLSGRVRALAAAGLLESQGDPSKMRFSEVRLPQ